MDATKFRDDGEMSNPDCDPTCFYFSSFFFFFFFFPLHRIVHTHPFPRPPSKRGLPEDMLPYFVSNPALVVGPITNTALLELFLDDHGLCYQLGH